MRVALPLGGTDWGESGIGTYVHSIIPHISRSLAQSGDGLFVFGNQRELRAYQACLDGVTRVRVPESFDRPALSAAWYLSSAPRFARKHGADVLLYPAAQRRCGLLQSLPTVAVVHDLGQLKLANKYDPLRMVYFRHLMLPLLRRATCLVAISAATRDDLMGALQLGEDRVQVILNGVDSARFRPLPADDSEIRAAREATGLVAPYVLYPARLEHPAKNHVRLLEGFSRSALRHSHVLALSGGDWGARVLIEKTIAQLGLGASVRILGFVADELVPGLFAGADAVVMVGLTEGFGLPALEALACGRPVCAARAGALPEVVGTLAVLCDPLDSDSIAASLAQTVHDEGFRTRCSREGPGWAQARGWDRTGAGLADACRQALRAQQSGARRCDRGLSAELECPTRAGASDSSEGTDASPVRT